MTITEFQQHIAHLEECYNCGDITYEDYMQQYTAFVEEYGD